MAKMMKKAQDGYTSYGAKAGTPSPVTDYAGKAGKQDSYTQYKKGGVIKKKAQSGMMAKKDPKEAAKRPMGMNFDKKSFDSLPKLKTKAKSGGAFGMLSVKAGIDKNPNPTQADRIAGAKGMAKKGAKVKAKMKMGGAMAKQAATAIAMKKAGKKPKSMMQYGGKSASMAPMMKKGGKAMGKCKYGC